MGGITGGSQQHCKQFAHSPFSAPDILWVGAEQEGSAKGAGRRRPESAGTEAYWSDASGHWHW